MTIWRYTCRSCGLVTRVEDGGEHRACACRAEYDVVNEEEEAASSEAQ